ncbi:MAG: geranylgeranylglycerol-phosphate geranylgeranyltransferase [Fidelibacterota bacterium]
MNFIWWHIQLLRPLNLLTSGFAMVVSAGILDSFYETKTLLITIGVVVCYNAAANAYNDVKDYKADTVNRPKRPLVTGHVKIKTAMSLAVILFVAGSIFAFGLPMIARVIAIGISMPIMIIYSGSLKGTPLIGNASIALILGLAFIFAGAAFNNIEPMIIPALLAFGLTFVRELVKDMADIEGDTKAGLNTFPVKFGMRKSGYITITAAFIIGLGSPIPFILGYYGLLYLIILVLGVEIPLAMIVFSFLKSPEIKQAKRFSEVLKFSTIAGLLAFFIDNYVN